MYVKSKKVFLFLVSVSLRPISKTLGLLSGGTSPSDSIFWMLYSTVVLSSVMHTMPALLRGCLPHVLDKLTSDELFGDECCRNKWTLLCFPLFPSS